MELVASEENYEMDGDFEYEESYEADLMESDDME
jgi:hypothetical protein